MLRAALARVAHAARARRTRSALVALSVPLGLVLALTAPAWGHGGDTSYVTLTPKGDVVDGVVDLDMVDAEGVLRVSRTELMAGRQRDVVMRYVASHLTLSDGSTPCPIDIDPSSFVIELRKIRFSFRFVARCSRAVETLDVTFNIFFDAGMAYYLGLVRLDGPSRETQLFSSLRRQGTFVVPTAAPPSGVDVSSVEVTPPRWSLRGLSSAMRTGVLHIWSGADHLLFLLALLMTSVETRVSGRWLPRESLRASLVDVAKVVTGFTLTHSVTLSLAALGLLRPEARIIEPAIAASVAVAALDNVHPFLRGRKWVIASSLGLLHGFGFASALHELALPEESLLETLFGFAVGVEIGQFVVVSAFVPVAFSLRRTDFYRRWVIGAGSVAITALALVWMIQRLVSPKG
jgi:hypothetical protein